MEPHHGSKPSIGTQAIVKKSDFVTGHKDARGPRLENTQANPRLVACSDAHNCTFATPCRRRSIPGAASTRCTYGCALLPEDRTREFDDERVDRTPTKIRARAG